MYQPWKADCFHFAAGGERRTECFHRCGSALQHRDPTSHGIEHDQNYAQDKNSHEHRIQIAGKYLAGLCGQWPENGLDSEYSRRHCRDSYEAHRNSRDPGIFLLAHINEEGSCYRQSDGRQQLISRSE